MIDVKTCKGRNGERIAIGDKVRYVTYEGKPISEEMTVSKIRKAGYFIELYTEGKKNPFFMPKNCIEKVR